MPSFKARVQEDMKSALRAGETLRLSVVRMLLAELGRYQADQGTEPDEATAFGLVEKMIKQRREAEQQFRAGARAELADKEAQEAKLLAAYLPEALGDAELAELLKQALAETGAAGVKDMGKVMAWLKPKVAGRTDMGRLSALVKSRLG